MALTVTPVFNPQPTLPFFPGAIPEINYGMATQPTINIVTVAMRVVNVRKNPCIGAGKGCKCSCCGSDATRPTITRRKRCKCHLADIGLIVIGGSKSGSKSRKELHGCGCVEEETHEMSAWEANMYGEYRDANGNVVLEDGWPVTGNQDSGAGYLLR